MPSTQVIGVPQEIEGCAAMIAQHAYRAYRHIDPDHRRWMDADDLMQEGRITALRALDNWRPDGGAKYSTHLFTALEWAYGRIKQGLRQSKRDAALVELDGPVPGLENVSRGDLLSEEQDDESLLPEELNCVSSFVELCRAVPDECKVVLLRGFLFGKPVYADQEVYGRIGEAAARLRIGSNDLRMLTGDGHEKIRKNILTEVAVGVMMEEGTESCRELSLLACTECNGKFSIRDVREGRFWPESMTCRMCLRSLSRSPESCFGRQYSPDTPECTMHCRDRRACKQFKEKNMSEELEGVDLEGLDEGVDTEPEAEEAEEPKKAKPVKGKGKSAKGKAVEKSKLAKAEGKGKPAKAAKAAAEKPAKAKKEVEEEDDPPPKGCTKWPFKRSSVMRDVFMAFYEGVTAKQVKSVQKQVEDRGCNWALMLRCMRRKASGKFFHTHTWQLNEEGGGFHIYDVKELKEPKAVLPKRKKEGSATTAKGKPDAKGGGKGKDKPKAAVAKKKAKVA